MNEHLAFLRKRLHYAENYLKSVISSFDVGLRTVTDVTNAQKMTDDARTELELYQKGVNDIGACPIVNCARHSVAKVTLKPKVKRSSNNTVTDQFQLPAKHLTAKINVNQGNSAVSVDNKFSNLKVDGASDGNASYAPPEPKLPPIMVKPDGANLTDNFDLLADFDLLGEKYNELCVLNDEIMNLMLLETEMNPADLDAETFASDEYNKKFKRINIIFKSKSNNREESDDSSCVQSISKRKFKLPLLELKKFGGEIKDWLPFWGQFSKIDSDPNIDEADKLQYLIQATLPSTRARELVESFPPSKENYHKAVDSLKSRFGQDDLLVEFYVRELLKLTISMNSRDQKVKLPTLYDRIETQLRALESLGVTTEKYAAMLFPLVESCLSEEVLRAWQRNNSFNDKKEESRLENLMQFLKNEVEGEERINLAMKGFSVKDNPKIYTLKKPMHTAAGLFAGTKA
ncbi:uncharacterized protein CDAR_258181 [Caerostris darwini]|uniref:Uncharacterized protein n=1 Tax=Caerostris darwini TaxID=1538125 RepID=A0AAV4WVD7_9ARAC|nr:uncharacterized protein CDAR_258181 [Caerostris darwini]